MTILYCQTNTLYQAGSGNIIGATSIVLTSLTDIYGNVLTMASFGAIGYITLEPDTTNEEAAIFTGITANTNGTYTLTGVSTILAQTPYTATSGLVRQHSGGTKVVITDNVAFWATFGNIDNANEWSQVQTFDLPPVSPTTPVNNTDVPNKAYVDAVVVAGAPNANTTTKGIVQLPTQAQVDAGTNTGSTGASLTPTPNQLRSKQRSDYVVDTGTSNTYVIAPSPAITAYAAGQEFTFNPGNTNTGASTLAVNGLTAKNITKNGTNPPIAGDIVAGTLITVMYDGTEFQLMSPSAIIAAAVKSGGTGSDGALSITSGTTTVSASSAPYLEKNYTNVSITSTGNLSFSTPATTGTTVAIFIQGTGTVTTSSTHAIDVRSMGGTANSGYVLLDSPASTTSGGGGSGGGSCGGAGTQGIASVSSSNQQLTVPGQAISPFSATQRYAPPGGNGSSGTSGGANGFGSGSGGAGGLGGGGLYVECAGAWNFTTGAIDASGNAGSASTHNSSGGEQGGDGGGGGGGNILVLYGTLTADSGTYTVSGGAGGTGNGSSGFAGASGIVYRALIKHFS